MRTIIASSVLVVFSLGALVAEEFVGTITGVKTADGKTTVSGKKGKKDDVKEWSFVVAKDVKVNKGSKKKGDATFTVGDAIKDGLQNEMFKDVSAEKGKGKQAFITTNDKNEITSILILGGKKKPTTTP